VSAPAWPEPADDAVVLRVLDITDAAAWQAGEDEEQRRWFQFPAPAPLDRVEAAIRSWRASWAVAGPRRHWGIWVAPGDRADPGAELAGGVEVIDLGDGRARLSYVVFPDWRRRGIATRAARLATSWALDALPVHAVVAIVDARNVASLGVVRAAGYAFDGPADPSEHDEDGPMLRFRYPAPGGSQQSPHDASRATR
jgi:RimJ/RimL family protein N-acetyltransferase